MGLALCCVLANCKVQSHSFLRHSATNLHIVHSKQEEKSHNYISKILNGTQYQCKISFGNQSLFKTAVCVPGCCLIQCYT